MLLLSRLKLVRRLRITSGRCCNHSFVSHLCFVLTVVIGTQEDKDMNAEVSKYVPPINAFYQLEIR